MKDEEATLTSRETLKLIQFFAIISVSFSVTYDRLEKRMSTHRARPPVGKEKNRKISQDAYQYKVFISVQS